MKQESSSVRWFGGRREPEQSLVDSVLTAARGLATRTLIMSSIGSAMVTGGLSIYLGAPLYTRLFFGHWGGWSERRNFKPMAALAWRIALRMLRDPSYRRMTATLSWRDWLDGPRRGPVGSKVRLHPSWEHGEGGCKDCTRCCDELACPMLDPDNGTCRVYGSPYWDYFSCGRYPATAEQIRYYGCEKWEFIGDSDASSEGQAERLVPEEASPCHHVCGFQGQCGDDVAAGRQEGAPAPRSAEG